MYQHLPPMLLNELQKQQRTITAQTQQIANQRATMLAMQQQLETQRQQLAVLEATRKDVVAVKAALAALLRESGSLSQTRL